MSGHVVAPLGALAALAMAGGGLLMAAARGSQEPIFSEAQAYERFMGRWSRAMAPLLVRFAGVRDGETILDVGSGTGALTASIVSAAPASRVVGIDPAAPYIALAQAQHASALVRFEVGDAQQMTFDAATFDRVVSLLVVNFIPDADKAMREMIRVAKPGGTIAAAVWDYGGGMGMLRIFWDEVVALTPAADARDERHMPLCRPGELTALWQRHGMHDVVEESLTIQTRFTSFDDYWKPFLDRQGPAGAYVASLEPGTRDALERRLRRRVLGDGPDRAFVLNARAWAVRGRRP